MYTPAETIKLLRSRIKTTKENWKNYKNLYEEHCRVYDIELAEKYFRWMQQEKAILQELEYLYSTITGKGVEL